MRKQQTTERRDAGEGDRFSGRSRRATTFKGKLDEPIQRWFSITPSYAPALVADCADHLGTGLTERYLDPFSGSGTTAVWCRLGALPCTAVEWNPALHVVSRVKAGWTADPAHFEAAARAFAHTWSVEMPPPKSIAAYLVAHAANMPRISHPERWWSPAALAAVTAARVTLARHPPDATTRPGIELALLRLLLPVSRARYNHASITFARDDGRPENAQEVARLVIDGFCATISEMAADLRAVADRPQRLATVLRGNALAIDAVVPDPGVYTRVICSPPYPNRYSYARETRPHLFFLDLVADARAVGVLDHEAMGGTWGRATSALTRPHAPATPAVATVMAPLLDPLRAAHPLMANYAIRYFNDFWTHIRALDRAMAHHARLAYVVGNSKLGGVNVPVAEWIARLFEADGWRRYGQGIHEMRRRNSRPGLTESVVFVER